MRFACKTLTGILLLASAFITTAASLHNPPQQADDPNPPNQTVKLIFIHHSTGENWLTDGYGDLGRTLDQNNYFVSDTNYGWGPDGIGDRTDIPDWLEWFRSDQTQTIMTALFSEDEQNASYTRTLADPGGENQVILFKSCFPNSELSGSPNDPPGTYADLSVAGAKYVYNQLLAYFITRPDKLFIVITAPPLSDPSYAANARAFNQWLVSDWLAESGYTGSNVAVFDFYNILTDPQAHHRYLDGAIEHTIGKQDTLHYPSGDDHPSEAGSRKATQEFVPLLNLYVNRWLQDTPQQVAEPVAPVPELYEDTTPSLPIGSGGLIDNFEGESPAGTGGWEPYWDASTTTTMTCGIDPTLAHSGSAALRVDFNISTGSWGTCGLFYDKPQDWSAGQGLTFQLQAAESGPILNIDLYVESPEGTESYVFQREIPVESVGSWIPVTLTWDQFRRVDWEAEAGTPFTKPDQVSGLAFGFNTGGSAPNTGTIWVDELQLVTSEPATSDDASPSTESAAEVEIQTSVPESELSPESSAEDGGGWLPCASALALPMGCIGLALSRQRRTLK